MASGKKRSFDAAFKLSVIEDAESTTNRAAARKFKVDERRIREWRQKKSELQKLPKKKKRLEGGGRKAALPEMEEELIAWIEGCRAKNFRVTRSSMQNQAVDLAKTQGSQCMTNGTFSLINFCVIQVLLSLRLVVVGWRNL